MTQNADPSEAVPFDDPGGVPFDDEFDVTEPLGVTTVDHDSPKSMQQRGIAYPTATPVGMKMLRDHVIGRWGGHNEGILTIPSRPIRGGSSPSLHNWGMAWDWRWENPGPGRAAADAVIEFCIANHLALGVQAVHDYVNARYWKNHAGWKAATPNPATGFGASWARWLHIERTWAHANLATPIEQLLKGVSAPPTGGSGSAKVASSSLQGTTTTTTTTIAGASAGWLPRGPLKLGDRGADVARVQDFLRFMHYADFTRSDGTFGPLTETAVKEAQTALAAKALYTKKIDGEWGPNTAKAAEASVK